MIISLNWLKKYTDVDVSIDELATLIGARLVEIEEVIDYGAKYKDVIVVRVVEASKLEGSDHLNITKIDDGGVTADIERDENGLIQVVCGAPNIAAGQLVAWLPPKSIVPETFTKPEPFVLGSRELRGVMSHGMIASARELDLFDEHEGILILDKDVPAGTSFAKVYELDDYLLDIENKSLTHRPDTFGIIGFAREVAAIQGKEFKTPDWLADIEPNFGEIEANEVSLSATIDDSELSDRYGAIVVSGADGRKKSPLQIQTYLARVGVRPINAIVDVTNYLMMLTGQPLHAFDYDKVIAVGNGNADIHVRAGRDKERLEILDGRTLELTQDDIVIAVGDTAIGLAGAMGGLNTAIDDNTKNIIIESATFNLYKLRSTQMRHGIFSEAVTRFTKGQPAELSAPVLFDAVRLMNEWAGARCVSSVAQAYPGKKEHEIINIPTGLVNGVLGDNMNVQKMVSTLKNAGFEVVIDNSNNLVTKSPWWRADIHISEDVIEEIGRLNGFDNIPTVLPTRDFIAVRPNDFDNFRKQLRKILVRAGANETLSYSFIHGDVLQKAGQNIENSYRIVNSISPRLQYYRQSITPSLLDLIHTNIKQGYDKFALFEVNKVHQKQDGLTNENVPVESNRAALVVTSKNKQIGAPYYRAKKILDYLCGSFGLTLIYESLVKDYDDPMAGPFEYRRSARVITGDGVFIGIVGECKKSVVKSFKLPEYTAGFEIDTMALLGAIQKLGSSYIPISHYPAAERDICFQVNNGVRYSQIINAVENDLRLVELESAISPVDIYRPDGGEMKNVTIRVKLTSYDHTLTSEEVSGVVNELVEAVISATNATVI